MAMVDGRRKYFDSHLSHLTQHLPLIYSDLSAVYCFKKALFLINGVAIRFSSHTDPPFPIPKTSHLPVFTDNVLPSMLIHLGVIDLSPCDATLAALFPGAGASQALDSLLALAPAQPSVTAERVPKAIPKGGPVLTVEQAYILRAAAIDACELIVQYAQAMDASELNDDGLAWVKNITLPDLDTWICAVAKDRTDYRRLERFVLTKTLYF
jgi:hypothetical protein